MTVVVIDDRFTTHHDHWLSYKISIDIEVCHVESIHEFYVRVFFVGQF